MASLSEDNINDIGAIVVAAIKDLFPKIINDQVPRIINEQVPGIINTSVPDIVRTIVREETADMRQETAVMRQDIATIREVQGSQGIMLRTLLTSTSQLKRLARDQGIFYEDLENRFTTLAEAVDENLTVRSTVVDHENRLTDIESSQTILKST